MRSIKEWFNLIIDTFNGEGEKGKDKLAWEKEKLAWEKEVDLVRPRVERIAQDALDLCGRGEKIAKAYRVHNPSRHCGLEMVWVSILDMSNYHPDAWAALKKGERPVKANRVVEACQYPTCSHTKVIINEEKPESNIFAENIHGGMVKILDNDSEDIKLQKKTYNCLIRTEKMQKRAESDRIPQTPFTYSFGQEN